MAASKKPKRRDADTPARERAPRATAAAPASVAAQTAPTATGDGPSRPVLFPVVGIGASAGGQAAVREFLSLLAPDSGMAFVVIQHLDPTRPSLTAEVLAQAATIPVVEAHEGARIEPNRTYVIPPDRDLEIEGRTLRVKPAGEPRGMRAPIDHFFRSLAQSEKERAIGIILSGAGHDGALGLREIKAAGGMVMVQSPETAAHDGMPKSAMATDEVDHVVPIRSMPELLLGYVRHWYVQGEPAAAAADAVPDHVRTILGLLRARTKCDFTGYKRGTITRRIQRRMGLHHVERTDDYVALLRNDRAELLALHRDLLIGVTNFYREPDAWAALEKQVIEPLVRERADDGPIRAWVPGCATGEEAYSLAIALLEQAQKAVPPVEAQVFASDIDVDALAFARAGVYPETIAADVPPERLRKYFTRGELSWRVNRQVRESVVFAEQNVIRDPPFSKLHVVSCRNLLIYLEPEVQKRVLSLFHFALLEGGYLFVGNSETITPQQKLFQTVSRTYHIFRRAGETAVSPTEIPPPQRPRPIPESTPTVTPPAAAGHRRLVTLAQQHLLRRFAPACALVTARGEVMYLSGPVDRYLQLPEGEPSSDLVALARGGLRQSLRNAIARAVAEKETVTLGNVPVQDGARRARVRVTVDPVREPSDLAGLFLVTFDDESPGGDGVPAPGPAATPPAERTVDADPAKDAVIHRLEEDPRSTREDLQTTIDELATSNEEFKATNEEMISINEELQSTNEELETSKEELQSLNEEMQTVNNQLEFKIDELEGLNNDLANLFANSDIATLFLDRSLKIRRFTPAARRLLHVTDTDLGRPFADLARAFSDESLLGDAGQVLDRLVPIEREVEGLEGGVFLRRISPYRTDDGRIDGVVITFTDITTRRRQEDELRRLNEGLTGRVARRTAEVRQLIRSSPDGKLIVNAEGRILEANERAEALFGYGPGELVGQGADVLVPVRLRGQLVGDWSRALREPHGATRAEGDLVGRRKDGSEVPLELRVDSLEIGDRPVAVVGVLDNSAHLRAERTSRRLAAVLASSPAAILLLSPDGVIEVWSSGAEALYGCPADEVVGRNASAALPGETAAQIRDLVGKLERGESAVGLSAVHERRDGSRVDVSVTGSPIHDGAGAIDGYCILSVDISHRRRAEHEVAEALDGERQRIGRDLHDTLGQQITAIGLLLNTLKSEAENGRPNPATLHNLEELVGQVKAQLRMLLKGVFPVAVDSAGLLWALYDLAHETSELFGVACRVENDTEVPVADNFQATELYWIAREALHNAVHHGRARDITISLTRGDELVLTVQDDGVGIPARVDETRTLGLRTMRHRSSIIGGRFSVTRAPGGGTTVRCTVPLALPPARSGR